MQKLQKTLQRLICSVVFVLMLQQNAFACSVEHELHAIPLGERVYLKHFFQQLFRYDDLGFVLFFDKPMCLAGAEKSSNSSYQERLFLKGWHVWEKYQDRFPHPNFLFCSDQDAVQLNLFVINKPALAACLQENETIFRSILGTAFSVQNFMHSLENGEKLLTLIHEDEALLGIMLGYGSESAMAFKEKHLLEDGIPEWTENYQGISIGVPKKCPLYPIGFMGNPSSAEVQALKRKYTQELEQLWNLSRGKDSLRLSLQRLCQLGS